MTLLPLAVLAVQTTDSLSARLEAKLEANVEKLDAVLERLVAISD